MKLSIAIFIMFISFFIIAYFDYKIAIEKSDFISVLWKYWWAIPILAFTAPCIWYGYRCIYTLSGDNVWLTSMINSTLIWLAFITGIYLASFEIPNRYQGFALILNLLSVYVASIK